MDQLASPFRIASSLQPGVRFFLNHGGRHLLPLAVVRFSDSCFPLREIAIEQASSLASPFAIEKFLRNCCRCAGMLVDRHYGAFRTIAKRTRPPACDRRRDLPLSVHRLSRSRRKRHAGGCPWISTAVDIPRLHALRSGADLRIDHVVIARGRSVSNEF